MAEINGTFGVINLCDECHYNRKPARTIFFEFSILGDKIGKIDPSHLDHLTSNGKKIIQNYNSESTESTGSTRRT